MKVVIRSFILLFLISNTTFAKKNSPPTQLYLYSVENKKYEEVKSPRLLRSRAYVKFIPMFNIWGFMVTNSDGDLSNPAEILGEGSVVSGQVLGAKNLFQNYELNAEGNWVRTKKDEQWVLWTASNPVEHRMETFVPAEKAMKYVKK